MAAPADELGTAISGTLQRSQAPLPPPPKATFADGLAAFFGGAPDLGGSYDQGIAARGKADSVSAQTLSALAQAEERRQTAMRTSFGNDVIMKAKAAGAGYQGSFADSIPFATSANDYTSSRLGDQKFGRNELIADPLADRTAQLAAMEAESGRPVERFYDSGTGMQASQINPTAAPTVTPVGQAQIANYKEQGTNATFVPGLGKPVNVGGVLRWSLTGNPVGDMERYPDAAAQIAAARAQGTATGQNAAALPDALSDIDRMRKSIKGLTEDTGFNLVYGRGGALANNPVGRFASENVASADARLKNLDAQSFAVAVQKMRGLGQLSNAEGSRVTEAFTRATNPALHPEQAREAWGEVLDYLDLAEVRAQRKATLGPAATAAPGGNAAPRSFNTEAEAQAAGIAPGTRVVIGGVPGTWE